MKMWGLLFLLAFCTVFFLSHSKRKLPP